MMVDRARCLLGARSLLLLAVTAVGCSYFSPDRVRYRKNPYERYSGSESFLYGLGAAGERNCELVWAASGTALSIPSTCVGCAFVFAVTLVYDGGPYAGQSRHDGTCADLEASGYYTYAYSDDYGSLLLGYYDYYVEWLPAELDEDARTFRYGGGVVDLELSAYGYAGTYYTYAWSGQAVLQ